MYNDAFTVFESDFGNQDGAKIYNRDNLIHLHNGIYYFDDNNRYHLFEHEVFDGEEEFNYRITVYKNSLANWVDALVALQNLPEPSKTG